MKNKITKNLIILGIIIFSFALANDASAVTNNYYYYYYNTAPAGSTQTNPNLNSNTSSSSTSSTSVNSIYDNSRFFIPNPIPVPKIVTNPTPIYNPNAVYGNSSYNYNNSLGASAYSGYNQANDNGSGITALSLRGSGSFMPSSIWQWLIVIILILTIIVISRIFIRKQTIVQEFHTATHTH